MIHVWLHTEKDLLEISVQKSYLFIYWLGETLYLKWCWSLHTTGRYIILFKYSISRNKHPRVQFKKGTIKALSTLYQSSTKKLKQFLALYKIYSCYLLLLVSYSIDFFSIITFLKLLIASAMMSTGVLSLFRKAKHSCRKTQLGRESKVTLAVFWLRVGMGDCDS